MSPIALTAPLLLAAVAAVAFGWAMGATAAFWHPFWDALLARAIEASGVLPTVLVAALVYAHGGPPRWVALAAILAFLRGVAIARLVRGELITSSQAQYVLAARALGVPKWRVVWRHVAPPVLLRTLVCAAAIPGLGLAIDLTAGILGLPTVARWPTSSGQPSAWLLAGMGVVLTSAWVSAASWLENRTRRHWHMSGPQTQPTSLVLPDRDC